ncbi:hypothetical protein H4582DRAFT_2063088 [Lactarius indigo]|nr:hypothetical protein H4582DRAFT_2063088 [Lactarius indigo]
MMRRRSGSAWRGLEAACWGLAWWWARWGGAAGRWWRGLARSIDVARRVSGDGSGVLRDITGRRGIKLEVAGSWTPGWGGVVAVEVVRSPRPVATSPPSYILDTATAPTHTTAISAQPVWPPLPQPMQDAADRSTTIPAVRKDDAHTPSAASASYASHHLLPSAPTPPAAVPHYTHYEEAVDDELGFGPANKISHAMHLAPHLAGPPTTSPHAR